MHMLVHIKKRITVAFRRRTQYEDSNEGSPNGSPSICLFHQKGKLSRNGPHLIPSLILFDKPRIGQVHTIHREVVLAGILQDADT